MKSGNAAKVKEEQSSLINKIYSEEKNPDQQLTSIVEEAESEVQDVEVVRISNTPSEIKKGNYDFAEEIEEEENLSLQEKELELIKKSLEKYHGKRKDAADELGISERTLYRKIKQYNL